MVNFCRIISMHQPSMHDLGLPFSHKKTTTDRHSHKKTRRFISPPPRTRENKNPPPTINTLSKTYIQRRRVRKEGWNQSLLFLHRPSIFFLKKKNDYVHSHHTHHLPLHCPLQHHFPLTTPPIASTTKPTITKETHGNSHGDGNQIQLHQPNNSLTHLHCHHHHTPCHH